MLQTYLHLGLKKLGRIPRQALGHAVDKDFAGNLAM